MHPSELAAKHPDKPAVMMSDSSAQLTFAQLDRGSCQVSRLLASLGVGSGDHIAVLMANRLEYFPIAWGAQRSLADGGAGSERLAAELMLNCRSRLASFKCPRSVEFVAILPRTPTGKLLRRRLREERRSS